MSDDPHLTELLNVARELEPDALAVLLAIGKRLALGRVAYGDLDLARDPRDFRKEAVDELLDGCVYLACETMRKDPAT